MSGSLPCGNKKLIRVNCKAVKQKSFICILDKKIFYYKIHTKWQSLEQQNKNNTCF
jgi:hypothetical protein